MFFINQKQKAKGCKGEYHELMHCVYRDQVKSNIETIGDYSRDKEIPIIFLIHPNFKKNKLFSNYSLISIHQDLYEISEDQGLIVLDLLEPYSSYSANNLGLDTWHPNKKGHKIIEEYLYEYLSGNNIDELKMEH